MPNRFIFSLRYANKMFRRFFLLSLGFIFFMSLFRLNLYFLSVHFHLEAVSFTQVLEGFWVGLQLDVLVFGYVLAPVALLLLVQALGEWWPPVAAWFYKIYFALIWIGVCLANLVDFAVFSPEGHRMGADEYRNLDVSRALDSLGGIPGKHLSIFLAVTALLLVLGLILVKEIRFGYWKDEYSPHRGSRGEVLLRVLTPLLLVGAMMINNPDPSSLTPDSLRQMALNPIWCFDK